MPECDHGRAEHEYKSRRRPEVHQELRHITGDRNTDPGVSLISMEAASPSHAKVSFCMIVPCYQSMLEMLCWQKVASVCAAIIVDAKVWNF